MRGLQQLMDFAAHGFHAVHFHRWLGQTTDCAPVENSNRRAVGTLDGAGARNRSRGENRHNRRADSRHDVHRARIARHKCTATFAQSGQLHQIDATDSNEYSTAPRIAGRNRVGSHFSAGADLRTQLLNRRQFGFKLFQQRRIGWRTEHEYSMSLVFA